VTPLSVQFRAVWAQLNRAGKLNNRYISFNGEPCGQNCITKLVNLGIVAESTLTIHEGNNPKSRRNACLVGDKRFKKFDEFMEKNVRI
jgi:hypothetical protein